MARAELRAVTGVVEMMSEELKLEPINGCNSNKRAGIAEAVSRAVMTIFGIVLVLTPLALWVAWSERVLLLVLVTGIAAMIGLLLCRWLADDHRYAAQNESECPPRTGPATVSDEFLEELSGMGPWTYHNRLTGDGKFMKKMERLRKLLKPD